ncbi:sensor domain-containing diguanylate cyclase [Vibrio salinus]|uniref:sensor domain-containing diguanylate cyclase n=1 Tax=Vibrio salinus TaxID=2899784 RepID=UPI001E2E00D1|nr:sensor domain-containing diguanylate cyclase [Vibrio salinus]MCE0494174.1 sensor domain-containing diguanylate cyclase [Vibrio salinus]
MTDLTIEQIDELEMLRAVIETSPDAIFVATESGHYLHVYAGNERTFDLDYQMIIGKHFTETHSPKCSSMIEETIKNAIETNLTQKVTYSLRPEEIYFIADSHIPDDDYWFEARVTPLSLKHFKERIILWNAREITQRVKLEQEVRLLVDHDELTGVFSRRRLMICLSEYFAEFRRYQKDTAVIMLDIDDFKSCNDQFGHLFGDKVIRQVAQTCSAELRACDMFGRLGGEEFAAILPHTGLTQACDLAERLRFAIETTDCKTEDGKSVHVTVSIGIAQFDVSDDEDSNVLNRADKAMYASKHSGKNKTTVFGECIRTRCN